jgi:hypothetical protein
MYKILLLPFFLSAFLLCNTFSAINAQNNSFSENPIAIRYQLKQEGLKGKVKKITLKDSTGKVISQEGYDTKGRITRKLVGSDRYAVLDNFSYDSVNKSILQKTEYATGEKVIYKYICNSNGDVTNYYIGSQDGTIFYSKRLYHYQDNLLLIDSAWNPGTFDSYTIHQYNTKGQIINSKTYIQKTRVLIAEITYEYKMQDGLPLIKILTKTDYSGGGRFENSTSIKYFDNNQNTIKEQNIGSTVYSVRPRELTYKLDATGNWISNSKKETREIEYYESLPATSKQTIEPANNNNQLSLILGEDFENNNNKWTVWDNENSAAQIINGNYRVTIKQSNNYAAWLGFYALSSDQSPDYAIETKISLKTTETGNPYDSYWLLWGLGNNGKDYYAFGIYPEGKFQYGKLVNNSWDGKAGAIYSSAINAGTNKTNVLRVEKRKDEIFFFINGIEVYKAKYEQFNINNAGVGFQWNNKKTLDIDYLKIFLGTTDKGVSSPEPYESAYQKALANAANSKQRKELLHQYFDQIIGLFYTTDQLKMLLTDKINQMVETDFYAIDLFRSGESKNTDRYKIAYQVIRNVLTTEQFDVLGWYIQYDIGQSGAQIYDQTTGITETAKPIAWNPKAPRPGYGWFSTVSSDKTTVTTANTVNKPAVTNPAPVDELTQLKDAMNYVKGRWVYLSKQQKHFYVPKYYTVTSLTDQIMLKEILAASTYDSYKARNVFSVKYSDGGSFTLPVTELVKALYTNTNSYIVTTIYQCSGCLGRGGTWNNNTRLGATCTTCGGSGCVSSQSGGGYSNMPYANFIY